MTDSTATRNPRDSHAKIVAIKGRIKAVTNVRNGFCFHHYSLNESRIKQLDETLVGLCVELASVNDEQSHRHTQIAVIEERIEAITSVRNIFAQNYCLNESRIKQLDETLVELCVKLASVNNEQSHRHTQIAIIKERIKAITSVRDGFALNYSLNESRIKQLDETLVGLCVKLAGINAEQTVYCTQIELIEERIKAITNVQDKFALNYSLNESRIKQLDETLVGLRVKLASA